MLLVVLATGCSVWRPLPGAGLARPASEPLDHARVFLRDGTEHELVDARVSPDSIIGFRRTGLTRFAVARSLVISVDAPEPDGERTFFLGALVPVSLAVVYVATIFALLAGTND